MKFIAPNYVAFLLALALFACKTKQNEQSSPYPSIFLVKDKTEGFASVADLKKIKKEGLQAKLWEDFLQQSEQDFKYAYLDPTIDFEGRNPVQLKHANVSYDMARGLCDRLSRSSLLFALTEEEKYKDLVLRQIEALYDETLWPHWCDKAHMRGGEPYVDIRTFRISMWVALAYNWMRDYLTEEEKKFIIDGLDRRAIQPFWEKLAQKPFWYQHRHNWFTNIFGGMAITAMALGDAHPQTTMLLDTIVPEMIAFNDIFGEMGEFNEPPGYAGAVRFSVEFAEAYRYYTKNERNLLNEKPFPETCYWILYHTLPPGRLTAFGDTPVERAMSSPAVMAAAANANQDPILQWYYEKNFTEMKSPLELLWYNPNLKAESPQGKLPLGVVYQEYGADLISRTSWDHESTACVVYGKAGRETNHDDNDVGQLLIDGFGERLIIDPGKPDPIYPADYFGENQYNYYSRSSKGHNVLVIGNQEMLAEPNRQARGEIVQSWFDDAIGSSWEIDLTPVYGNAGKVSRKVAHLFPGIALVHDLAELPAPDSVVLRWHTIKPPKLNQSGDFWVRNNKAAVSAKVVALDKHKLTFSSGRHAYKPPYNLSRQGDPLVQNHEPFVKITTYGKRCSILTLFAVSAYGEERLEWEETESGWLIRYNNDEYRIARQGSGFKVSSKNSGGSILLE